MSLITEPAHNIVTQVARSNLKNIYLGLLTFKLAPRWIKYA